MSVYEKKYFWIVPLGLAGISFLFFQLFYPYHLFFKEQIQLFLYTSDYFLSYFNKPAWLACYAGDFLTQFLYLRFGGATVLSLLFILEWLIFQRIIHRMTSTTKATLWAMLPVMADWMLHCGVLYGIPVSVGFIISLLLFQVYTLFSNRWLSMAAGPAITFAAYWLAGMSAILLPVLIIAWDWKQGRFSSLKGMAAGTMALLNPLAWRHVYLLTLVQSYLYPAFQVKSLLLPATFILTLALAFHFRKYETRQSKWFNFGLPLASLGWLVVGIGVNANFHLEKILSLDSETYFGQTERVIELSKKYQLKDRRATYFTNLALAEKEALGEHLLEYYQPSFHGLIMPVMPTESWQSIFVSNEVFYLMGDMNLAQHSAMLGNTFSPFQRSSRMIRRLAEINLVNGDSAAAGKYLRLLSKTLFHKKWAQSRQRMNHAADSSAWLVEKRKQIAGSDILRKSYDRLASLHFLVGQHPENVIALDYLLCHYLLAKDLKSFLNVYEQYGRGIKRPVPSVYSEALLIHLFASKASREEAAGYSIDPRKLKDFMAYTQLYDQTKGEMKALERDFGKTYWFYFHFATLQNQ